MQLSILQMRSTLMMRTIRMGRQLKLCEQKLQKSMEKPNKVLRPFIFMRCWLVIDLMTSLITAKHVKLRKLSMISTSLSLYSLPSLKTLQRFLHSA